MPGDVHAVEDVHRQGVECLNKQLIAGGECNCSVEANVFFNAELSVRIGLVQRLESLVDCYEVLERPALSSKSGCLSFESNAKLKTTHQVSHSPDRGQAEKFTTGLALYVSARSPACDRDPISMQADQCFTYHCARNGVFGAQLTLRRQPFADFELAGDDLLENVLVDPVGVSGRGLLCPSRLLYRNCLNHFRLSLTRHNLNQSASQLVRLQFGDRLIIYVPQLPDCQDL